MAKAFSEGSFSLVLLLVAGVVTFAGNAPAAETQRPDLMTFARGTVFVSQTGLASGSAGVALLAVDGDP